MFGIKTYIKQLNSEILLLFILFGLTVFSTSFNATFIYGNTLTYTSIFIFLLFRLFGLPFALWASLITLLIPPFDSIYLFYKVIFLLEIIFVSTYFHIKKRAKMFFVDLFFWLTIGLLTIFLTKTLFAGEVLYFQTLKVILNGLLNVLIADMLLAYLPFYKLMKSKRLNKNNVSVHQFLSHLTILSIMIPFFLSIYPISQDQDQVFKDFIPHLKLLLIYSVLTILFVQVISRLFMKNIQQLVTITTDLPKKLFNLEKIEFPQSNIAEIRSLTQNLQLMSQKLKELFKESIEMNTLLINQTNKLKESEQKLHQLAYYDYLTTLPNRLYFQSYVKDLIKQNQLKKIAIIFLDINQFKQVNDTLGHDAGDNLLQLTANRLNTLTNHQLKVFRLGGDEFVIVQAVNCQSEVELSLEKIKKEFSSPFRVNEKVLYITLSIGISLFPEDGRDLDTLVKYADIAMYVSKEKGGNATEFFNDTMKQKYRERLVLENCLRTAINEGGFELFYQPKIQFGQISSVEALLRLNDPIQGHVSPDKFIPIAEENGLISKIDEWVLIEACRQNKRWQEENFGKVPISVNISAINLQQNYLIPLVERALIETGLSPEYLKLEITENVFIKNPKQVVEVINQLRNLGVRISIDDFGKGYSSFNHLLQLPIDEIKIDSHFIKDIHQDEKKALIVKSILDIAHGLRLNVVAEGVETENEKDFLIHLGCDEIQGYLFSRPLNEAGMGNLFRDWGIQKKLEKLKD